MQLLSDRGSHFVNEVIDSLLKLIGTQHCLTIAYSKQENSMAERAVKEAKRHVIAMVNDVTENVRDYKLFLPLVMRIINTTTSALTTVRPCDILYGKAINPDRGIFLPMDERVGVTTPPEHLQKLTEVQEHLIELARTKLRRHDEEHRALADTQVPTDFPIGSHVLLSYTDRPPTRDTPPLEGPLQVLENLGNSQYVLLDLVDQRRRTVHASRMRGYNTDPAFAEPLVVAARDRKEIRIDAILDHRGSWSRKASLEFKVRWVGFSDEHDEWLPWKDLYRTTQLVAYLRKIGKQAHIPKDLK